MHPAEREATLRLEHDRHVGAAQQRPHAREQFAQRERFRHVVVGAEFEPEHFVALAAARRQQHHGLFLVALANGLQDLEARRPRQHHVEHEQVEGARPQDGECLVAIGGSRHRVAFAGERVGERRAQSAVVLDQEDAGGHGSDGEGCGLEASLLRAASGMERTKRAPVDETGSTQTRSPPC